MKKRVILLQNRVSSEKFKIVFDLLTSKMTMWSNNNLLLSQCYVCTHKSFHGFNNYLFFVQV